jgi:hypothetical protein
MTDVWRYVPPDVGSLLSEMVLTLKTRVGDLVVVGEH